MAKKKTENIKAAPMRGPAQPTPTPETPVITKSYSVRDDWKDKDIVNYVAFKSVDGEVQDLTVNGEPAGGGGGGDLKIAEVTVINNMTNDAVQMNDTYVVDEETGINSVTNLVYNGASGIWKIIVYKNMPTGGQLSAPTATYTVTGGIADDGDGYLYVSGNGTITIS